jgi:hypothetical protein
MRIEIKQEFLGFIGDVRFSNPDMFSAIETLLKNTDLEEKLDKIEQIKVNIFIEKLKNSIEEISDILKKDFYDSTYLIQLDFENRTGECNEQRYKVTANGEIQDFKYFPETQKLNNILKEYLWK